MFIEEQSSQELLHEVVECWFTIRGFSVASKVFEQYKKQRRLISAGKKEQEKNIMESNSSMRLYIHNICFSYNTCLTRNCTIYLKPL